MIFFCVCWMISSNFCTTMLQCHQATSRGRHITSKGHASFLIQVATVVWECFPLTRVLIFCVKIFFVQTDIQCGKLPKYPSTSWRSRQRSMEEFKTCCIWGLSQCFNGLFVLATFSLVLLVPFVTWLLAGANACKGRCEDKGSLGSGREFLGFKYFSINITFQMFTPDLHLQLSS